MQKRVLKIALLLFVAENNSGKAKTCYAHLSGKASGSMNNRPGINYLKSMPKGAGLPGDAKRCGGVTKIP